ncbi:hypothetical protein TNCV_4965741 [Trichonephila clavipes]|nr:hypothetical protein TNCV_4965741 [Trichonephila clavipes]
MGTPPISTSTISAWKPNRREIFSSPHHSQLNPQDYGPTDLTSTYSVCTQEYLVASGIEHRPSGLESDALTTRLPTALD